MKKRIKRLFLKLFARKEFQNTYEKLHVLILRVMNYGAATGSPEDSGEKYLLEYLKKKLGPGLVIFDVGANTGQFATLVNDVYNDAVSLYSFEPTKRSFEKLKTKFDGSRNTKIFKLGLGKEACSIELFYDNEGSVLASAFHEPGKNLLKEDVEITTLDTFAKEHNIEHIDLLKIDVEGYELFVIEGAKNLIAGANIKYVQFEFGNAHILSRHFLYDFAAALPGFKLYRLLQNGFYPIDIGNTRHEIFQTSNYVAIREDMVVTR